MKHLGSTYQERLAGGLLEMQGVPARELVRAGFWFAAGAVLFCVAVCAVVMFIGVGLGECLP